MEFTPGKLYKVNCDLLVFNLVEDDRNFWVRRDNLLLFLGYIEDPDPEFFDNQPVLCFLYDNKKICSRMF